MSGSLAQLVEQRTENPCVTGSNPVGATICPVFWYGMWDLKKILHAYFIFTFSVFFLQFGDTYHHFFQEKDETGDCRHYFPVCFVMCIYTLKILKINEAKKLLKIL